MTDRERDVFTLLALGYTVMRKLRLHTRAELVLLALSSGVVGA